MKDGGSFSVKILSRAWHARTQLFQTVQSGNRFHSGFYLETISTERRRYIAREEPAATFIPLKRQRRVVSRPACASRE